MSEPTFPKKQKSSPVVKVPCDFHPNAEATGEHDCSDCLKKYAICGDDREDNCFNCGRQVCFACRVSGPGHDFFLYFLCKQCVILHQQASSSVAVPQALPDRTVDWWHQMQVLQTSGAQLLVHSSAPQPIANPIFVNTVSTKRKGTLRIMSWNVANLGGRYGSAPARDPNAMNGIAQMILCLEPDICAIMEAIDNSHKGGEKELRRLAGLLPGYELLWPGAYTAGESYGLFVKKSPGISGQCGFEDIGLDKKYRQPLWAQFDFKGVYASSRGPWSLGGIVFHAPSPSHGEDTARAVEALGKSKMCTIPDAFMAGDFNFELEDDPGSGARKFDKDRDAYFDPLETAGFMNWTALGTVQRTTIRNKPIIEQELIEADDLMDEGNRMVKTDVSGSTAFRDTRDLYASNYDQILLKAGGVLTDPVLLVPDLLALVAPGFVIKDLAKRHGTQFPDYASALFETVWPLYQKAEIEPVDILRVAKMLSDHAPILVDVVIQ
jgi:hypothetical protein